MIIAKQRYFLNLFDLVSYFSLTHIVLFFLGTFYRYFYEWAVPISNSSLVLICISMLSFACGSSLQSIIGSSASVFRYKKTSQQQNINNDFDQYFSSSALFLFFIGVAGVLVFIIKNGGIIWLRSDFDDYRIVARAGIGWLVIISITFITYSSIALFTKHLFCRNLIFALFYAISGTLLVIQFGNRAPALEIIVACAFIYCWHKWQKIPILLLVGGGLSALFLLGALQIYRQGIEATLLMLGLQTMWRPFVNIQNFDLIYNSVPSIIPYQNGNSFLMDLAVLAPGYQPNFGTWLKDALGLDFTGGSVTVTYLGEFYANFGYLGSVICSFTLGFILSLISSKLQRFYFVPAYYPLLFGITISAKAIVSSGLISPILYLLIPYLLTQCLFNSSIYIR
ncbi:MAG: O-antigen ligase, partial [Geobacteraceae bacterium]|nr:O-antigen ligase [Geobacteraceae bacterium]